MQAKKGFTLIELLVVIAIIAILAAILFPVFANARDKARQISGLSNHKQIALGILMYTNDYDDTFPIGQSMNDDKNGNVLPDTTNWVLEVIPYLGTTAILYGPNDTDAGIPADNGYAGKAMSVGVNALTLIPVDPTATSTLRGGVFQASSAFWGGTSNRGLVCKLSEASQPTTTILTADESSVDVGKLNDAPGIAAWGWKPNYNCTGFGMPSLIGDQQGEYWNAGEGAANSTSLIWASGNGNYYQQGNKIAEAANNYDWGGYWAIPSPMRGASNAYPNGPNGLVSTPYSSKTLANFTFVDGHAKAMKPVATNPDGYVYNSDGTYDSNNMWVVSR
jgi:prepilin-type N-terminal cleavage/methylation domain-containing protein/prepilin-type processing-associated H-X9-DG protein